MAKKLPTAANFFLADSVREESGGKLTLIGFYSGNELILNGPLPKKLPADAQSIALPGLSILITFFGGKGKFSLDIQLFDPKGIEFAPAHRSEISIETPGAQNVILPIIPFPIKAFGKYMLRVKLDKQSYDYEFIVRHRDPKAKLHVVEEKKVGEKSKSSPKSRGKQRVINKTS